MPNEKNVQLVNRLLKTSLTASGQNRSKCMQDDDDGKYYCFKKVQGRWEQCDGIPYDTLEECQLALDEQ